MNEYVWEDLQIGLHEQFEVLITREMMSSFAELSGDSNPLHGNAEYARQHGFRDQVVFGMLASSFYSRLVGVHLPGKYSLLHGIDIHFVSPVYIGDKLLVRGEIEFLSESVRRVELRASIRNQAGLLVSKAKIRVGLHAR
ncbi:MAG: MaoC/PaaZ C-terminal domain-containing protein [Candidatus Acidiferrum sp.]